ncbi:MAG: inositol polyphosphate kinase family protein [Desulfobacterales bacterium]|nr:inositol polyphosphate kinase family protein [Desulfobacterales bacterium]
MSETGGHGGIQISGPIMMKETNLIEREFYQSIFPFPPPTIPRGGTVPQGLARHSRIAQHTPEIHATLRNYVPYYYGLEQGTERIVLENLAYGLEHPQFFDVKIGAKTCSMGELVAAGRGASSAWKKKQKLKMADYFTLSSKRGFRMVAVSCFPKDGRKELARRDPSLVIRKYFESAIKGGGSPIALRREASDKVNAILSQVAWDDYAMIAASILFVMGKTSVSSMRPQWICRVKLIDFAHTYHRSRLGRLSDSQLTKYSRNFSQGLAAFGHLLGAGVGTASPHGRPMPHA